MWNITKPWEFLSQSDKKSTVKNNWSDHKKRTQRTKTNKTKTKTQIYGAPKKVIQPGFSDVFRECYRSAEAWNKKEKEKKRNKVARGLNRSIHFSFFVCLSIRSRYPKGEIEILGNNFKDPLAIVTALSWNMLHQTTLESNWNQEQFELNCCKISYCGKFSPDHTDNLKNSREINT